MYKKFAALLLAVIMVFAMFGCQGATEPNQNSTVAPTQGNNDPAQTNTETNTPAQNAEKVYTTYTQVYSAEVSTLNYLQSTATDVTVLGSLCVDGLVEFDRYGVMQPCLAESWDVSDDGTVYTFHLRKGVMWYTYEGEEYAEVKAGDFVAAAEYVLNAANASKVSNTLYHNIAGAKDYYDGITADFSTVGIKALDDYTVEYTLVAPLPYFIKMVSLNPWFPAQADFLAEQGDQFGTSNDTLLYCGAYLFDTFEPEYQRVLVMNENYWHSDIISIKKLVWKYNKEASANGPELYLRGETDKVTLGTDIIEEWKADPDLWDQVHPAQLIAHDLSIMRFITNRLAVIRKGRIVELSETEKLFAHPLHPYTKSLLSAIPQPDPLSEKGKKALPYDPACHDYSVDKPEWLELEDGHFVLANNKEAEQYRKELAN